MKVPDSLRYTTDHEWVQDCGDVMRVGLTDYAQDALGDVVFVQLPCVGDLIQAGSPAGEVESTKSVSDVFAPVGGVVTAVNHQLSTEPSLLNRDPYGEGWWCEIRVTAPPDLSDLLDASGYRTYIGA